MSPTSAHIFSIMPMSIPDTLESDFKMSLFEIPSLIFSYSGANFPWRMYIIFVISFSCEFDNSSEIISTFLNKLEF